MGTERALDLGADDQQLGEGRLARFPAPSQHRVELGRVRDRTAALVQRSGEGLERRPCRRDLGPDRVKPKPDIFLHGAKQMGVDPSRVLVIEDSVHGIHGARAAGMRVVGFTGGSHTFPSHADKLTEAGAETVISRMTALPGVIAALSEWSESMTA